MDKERVKLLLLAAKSLEEMLFIQTKALASLQSQRQNLITRARKAKPIIHKPNEKVLRTTNYHDVAAVIRKEYLWLFLFILVFLTIIVTMYGIPYYVSLVITFVVISIVYYFTCILVYKKKRKENELSNKKDNDEYEKLLNKYKAEKEKEDSRVAIEVENLQSLDSIISKLENDINVWTIRLNSLYDQGNLYEKFCNLEAITTIHSYLDSGICSELEGPYGAYAQYMQDIRVDRIVQSINGMRASIEKGFMRQERLQLEANGLLHGIRDDFSLLNSKIDNIKDGINSIGRHSEAMTNSLRSMHHQLDNIQQSTYWSAVNTSISALNQYTQIREETANRYFLRYPQ